MTGWQWVAWPVALAVAVWAAARRHPGDERATTDYQRLMCQTPGCECNWR